MPGGEGAQDQKIVDAVRNGTLSEEVLDQTAEELEGEYAVLLKNEYAILPLDHIKKAVFIGAFAKILRFQGYGSSKVNASRTESEGEDRKFLDLPGVQNCLIREVAKAQKKMVVVLHVGAPAILLWREQVKGILNLYLGGGAVGSAAVSLLYGEKNPSGKLAESWLLKLSNNPSYLNFPSEDGTVTYRESVFIGYRYYDKKEMEVTWPFGYGLSYTTFQYRALALEKEEMKDTEKLRLTVRIKNTGPRVGKETVQLYIPRSFPERSVRCANSKVSRRSACSPERKKDLHFFWGKHPLHIIIQKSQTGMWRAGDTP